jgi:folate-binding Fe-S cluster repair protein YgfZ
MSMQCNSVVLESFGVLRARGTDVVPFLQGQLSCDVRALSAETSLLAGYHNPQGRAIALLRLVQLAADDVLAVLPRALVSVVAARLGKFILRAKVKLADESSLWTLEGVLAGEAGLAAAPGLLCRTRRAGPLVAGCLAPQRHRRRGTAGVRGDLGSVRGADAQS